MFLIRKSPDSLKVPLLIKVEAPDEPRIEPVCSAAGRVDCHLLERQRRVAGDGGDHELVGGYGRSIHLDPAVEAGRRSAFSLCIAPFVVGAREGDEIGVSGRQRQRLKGSQIGGRGQVVGLAGNERTFLVSGRQSVGIIVGDDFQ